jgi:hypothetical protein
MEDGKNKMLAILIMSIKDEIISYIINEEDPTMCWKML